MPAVVAHSSSSSHPSSAHIVVSPVNSLSRPISNFGRNDFAFYNNPFDYQYRYYNYPYYNYTYPNLYAQPTFYGTCASVSGVGVVSDNCLPGTTPVSTSGNGCYCYDRYTGFAGCANVANGVCRLPTAAQPIIQTPQIIIQKPLL